MPIRSQDWYDLNESRPYPLSDEATGVDDAGLRLPSGLIADLHLSFPLSAGRRAMIGAVTVTKKIATVTFLATTAPGSPAAFVPLAAVTVSKPIDKHRMYPLEALYPGAGGWIVFGSPAADTEDEAEEYTGRFLTAAQSILLPSTAKAYEDLPIPNLARLGNEVALTGLVSLLGGNDIEVVKECREIPANLPALGTPNCDPLITTLREVIVIRLVETDGNTENPRNLFDTYRGPCGGRPESLSCGDPAPIEFLASVPPDCCGNITVRFRGCSTLSEITEEAVVDSEGFVLSTKVSCGLVIDCDLGLTEACVTADRLPDEFGNLPDQANDLCESETSITVTLPPVIVEESETFFQDEESESAAADPGLPHCDSFETTPPDHTVRLGRFEHQPGIWTTEGADVGEAFKNISTRDFLYDPRYKRVSIGFTMLSGGPGVRHNAGVIANYRESSPGSNRFSYYFAEVDWDAAINGFKFFQVGFFDGTNKTLLTEQVTLPDLEINRRYNMCLTILGNEDTPIAAWVKAELTSLDCTTNVSVGPISVADFGTFSGQFGMTSDHAATVFQKWCVENTTDPEGIPCGNLGTCS